MASAALALLALRLIMTAAVAIEAMIEIIREQMIRMASGEAELEPDLQVPSSFWVKPSLHVHLPSAIFWLSPLQVTHLSLR